MQIESERDFSSKLAINAKAKYGLFSAGAAHVAAEDFNSYSTYLAVVARIDKRTLRSDRPTLRPSAIQLANNNMTIFRQRCGNGYVRALTKGGEYSALVEVFSVTEAERQDSKLKAAGAVGIFTASAEASAQLSKFLTNRRYTVKLIRKGGSGAIAASPDKILGDALAYPELLSKAPDGALSPTRAEILDYRTLLDFPATESAEQLSDTEKLLQLERYDELAAQRRQHAADIQYILDNPEQFVLTATNLVDLQSHLETLHKAIFEMKSDVARCLDAVGARCDLKEPSASYLISLPMRRPGPTREQLISERDDLKQRIARSTAVLAPLYDPATPLRPGSIDVDVRANCMGSGSGLQIMCFAAISRYCQKYRCIP
ncbi:hypothetical protein LJR267_010613 [Paraburkholderia hospita]|uniref:hypothetical protein n=1 Tax=Paraburkholderia hospita TaxID=169430 RepID=UPI003ED11C3C